ncbi:hypothetical protein F5877DRAFT_2374, partial [Lentinula edodes]
FMFNIKELYNHDCMFSKILKRSEDCSRCTVEKMILGGNRTLCIPESPKGLRSLRGAILDEGQRLIGHFGPQRTSDYIRLFYWW